MGSNFSSPEISILGGFIMEGERKLKLQALPALTPEQVLDLQLRLAELEEQNLQLLEDVHTLAVESEELSTELKVAKSEAEEAREELGIDALTGAMNRRGAIKEMEKLRRIKHTDEKRNPDERKHLCLLLGDVDGFKTEINEKMGKVVGDQVLAEVAAHLEKVFRRTDDLIIRWGGDEFIVICKGSSATRVMEEVLSHLRDEKGWARLRFPAKLTFARSEMEIPVSISAGITDVQPGESWDMAIARADKGLSQAKERYDANLAKHRKKVDKLHAEGKPALRLEAALGGYIIKVSPRPDDQILLRPSHVETNSVG